MVCVGVSEGQLVTEGVNVSNGTVSVRDWVGDGEYVGLMLKVAVTYGVRVDPGGTYSDSPWMISVESPRQLACWRALMVTPYRWLSPYNVSFPATT